MESEKHFIFFDNLILVKGFTSSIIIDPHNFDIDCIPNYLYDFVKKFNKKQIGYINSNHSDSEFLTEDAIRFFVNKNFAFLGNKLDIQLSTSFELSYDAPYLIENGIIDYCGEFKLSTAFDQFDKIGCPFLQLRIFPSVFKPDFIDHLLNDFIVFEKSSVRFIELFVPFFDKRANGGFLAEIVKNNRIRVVVFYSAPESNFDQVGAAKVFWTTENYESEKMCGQVGMGYFSINPNAVFESYHHNSCLNRKISIDAQGNIKNCPSMKESYGNIRDTTLAEALEKPGFKKYWDINKDKIHVCKDCEFRYICTDCRAYVEDPEDILSKPLKCGYNPYTGEWSEWSTNPLKQKAIDFYGMREMVDREIKTRKDKF